MNITLLLARIRTEGPWAVAAPEVAQAIDRPIAADGWGNTYLPTTSLAGSLRAHLREEGLAESLMGPEPPEGGDDRLSSSKLRLCGTAIDVTRPTLRHQTAVDRKRGAAGARTLRSSQSHDGDQVIALYLRVDGTVTEDELGALASWNPRIGSGRSHGMGRARLEELIYGTLDLTTSEGLKAWLGSGGPSLHEAVCTTPVPLGGPESEEPWIQARLRIADGLLSAVEGGEDDADSVPWRRGGTPLLEGASIKGVFRSRAAYILASLGRGVCVLSEDDVDACGECDVCAVFGALDLPATVVFREAMVQATPERRPHVAIDRVTGGAASELGSLWDEEILVGGELVLRIDEGVTAPPVWARPLLLHVLRDVADGLVGLGSRTTRGLGSLKLVEGPIDELEELDRVDVQAFRELVA